MRIGVPREIKPDEYRVAATPAGVRVMTEAGHDVWLEAGAGSGSGFEDELYRDAGAHIADMATAVWSNAEMILKVKEPLPAEYGYFREGLVLFAYLHLAAHPELTSKLAANRVTAIGYETVQEADRSLPLLTPMSEIAGRMSVQIGASLLEKTHGGSGRLLGGVPGVRPCEVAIIGGGTVGTNAAKIAAGLGANVTILDRDLKRLRELEEAFQGRAVTLYSTSASIDEAVQAADLLIGAVLVPGKRAPKLVREDSVKQMRPGSVIVDVAVDQGGSIETIDRVTTHASPVYVKHGVLHYAVANMPGAVPATSTAALTNATLPYVLELASCRGRQMAECCSPALQRGIQVIEGKVRISDVEGAAGDVT